MKAAASMQNERMFQKAMAIASAKDYCRENGISWELLQKQRFDLLGMTAVFSQPSPSQPQGLVNDMETQPKPTLIIRYLDGDLVFEQTEYTRQYLAQ